MILVIFFSLSSSLINLPVALSHRPHDVVDQVELSSNYDDNKTVFIVVRGNLFKSEDGGKTWQRLWEGLDNIDNLVTLSVSANNDNVIFTSSLYSGIYKSEDGGQSWLKANEGLNIKNTKIDLLEISPNSDNFVLAADSEKGIYKSEDRGQSWSQIFQNDEQTKITKIAFIKDQPETILMADSVGNIRISNNEGESWETLLTLNNNSKITALQVSPNFITDKTIWVGTEKNGVYIIADGKIKEELKSKKVADKFIRDIAFSTNYDTDSTLFISTWNNGVFRSRDGGKSWTNFKKGLTKSEQADEKQFNAPHFDEIRLSNNFEQDNTLFLAGFDGIFKSTDEGETWQNLNSLSSRIVIGLDVSPNYENDSTIAVIDYVGQAHISYDQGQSWSAMRAGLELPNFTKSLRVPTDDPRRFFDIAFSPNYAEDQILFLGLLRDYILKSSDQGKNWKIINLPNVPKSFVRGTFLAISPKISEDNTVYVATNAGTLYKSVDKGENFSILTELKKRITSLIISPNFASDKTLYAATFEGIYKSEDEGVSWQLITQAESSQDLVWWGLAISPNYQEDQTLIAGSSNGAFKTTDAGKSWIKINGLPYDNNNQVTEVAISPNYKNDETFMVTLLGEGTFKTVDGGQTFSLIDDEQIYLSRINTVPSASIPIQFSPSYGTDNTIYGFGSAEPEIYKSTDSGNSWKVIPISSSDKSLVDYINYIPFIIYADRVHLFKLLVALLIAVISYLILGYIKLNKKRRLNHLVIRLGATFLIFIISIILMY
ncbi:WD40/YVTN/BNR-like repeat-containing protein [Crocosphaera chwakensis]|uniref:Glycosyl hydrolase, BNR repeat n=1 Tax=Crocosphaera chwakensis CCY0110 TaxID=391612 RepID=A3IVG0_9CHRO|nr:YCF48-related protein [Crocosphaera chwakensis]EAZ89532.1 glycosyl hydrolase, BNR repeat [Crocosphaera chwakensis CCY0110]